MNLSQFAKDVVTQATADLRETSRTAIGNPYSDSILRRLWAAVSNNDVEATMQVWETMGAIAMLSEWWDGEYDTTPLADLTDALRSVPGYEDRMGALYSLNYDQLADVANRFDNPTPSKVRALLDW